MWTYVWSSQIMIFYITGTGPGGTALGVPKENGDPLSPIKWIM